MSRWLRGEECYPYGGSDVSPGAAKGVSVRWVWRILGVVVLLAVLGALAFRWWFGPAPDAILQAHPSPPAPVQSPAEALADFEVAPGFAVELVAAEPLVVDPVAMDWDDQGRLYVVEMRGFMPNVDGAGEDAPIGQVVVLEDEDGDGRMDRRDVFLDGLVLPRAIAVLPQGVLIGAPPNLLWCRDSNDDRACDEPVRLTHYGLGAHDPEHLENALLPALDGWIYNAKSKRRFRLHFDDVTDAVAPDPIELEVGAVPMRGQWGLAQDDAGRQYHNHNSSFLFVDRFPAAYAMRQRATATQLGAPGLGVGLSAGEEVHGTRIAAGLNRAYLPGTLRPDGRQKAPTAVSGLVVQRGDQFGPDAVGDAFVPEAGGSAVARFDVDWSSAGPTATHVTVADERFERREFLTSPDERFRPVDVKVGPDGALWVIDMYRGIIQHANYLSDHARADIAARDLAAPGETGRIWRVRRSDRAISYAPPPLHAEEDWLRGLDHPNGWVRDRAQRRLIAAPSDRALAELRALDQFGALGRTHALWTLAGMGAGALDEGTWRAGLADAEASVRRTALQAGTALLSASTIPTVISALEDPDASVRLQALFTLGEAPADARPIARMLDAARSGDALTRFAVLSGIAGHEPRALEDEIGVGASDWLEAVAGAAWLAARASGSPAEAVAAQLDRVAAVTSAPVRASVVRGFVDAQRRPGVGAIELTQAHAVFDAVEMTDEAGLALRSLRRTVTWPGDPSPGGATPLTSAEEARRERGADLFAASCAACHGAEGRGQAGVAPPLVGSPWVRDADDWLARIVLGGLQGPIVVADQEWNLAMPGHAHDARFDDEGLAGLMTFLRRAWGHADAPVTPETVAAIRAASADRKVPWTADELLALSVEHRLDAYAGIYRVPVVGLELEAARQRTVLAFGMKGGGKQPLAEVGPDAFAAEGLALEFQRDDSGAVSSATIVRAGQAFTIDREAP